MVKNMTHRNNVEENEIVSQDKGNGRMMGRGKKKGNGKRMGG